MLPSLIAALVPAVVPALEPPRLPANGGRAMVGVVLEDDTLRAHNYADTPRWLVLRNGPFALARALAPHGDVQWSFSESCLWDIELEVAEVAGDGLHESGRVSLLTVLESGAHALWFGQDASCWLENTAAFVPMLGEDGALGPAAPEAKDRSHDHGPLHVPVVRPSDRPDGDRPPPIDGKPLPPI